MKIRHSDGSKQISKRVLQEIGIINKPLSMNKVNKVGSEGCPLATKVKKMEK